jgi:two-component system OmpR family response regulator
MRILLVEDEPALARAVRKALEEEGFAVDVEADGEGGLYAAQGGTYDAVVLDVMLPRRDGWSVLRALRASRATPVLLLTARDAVADRVRGLNGGADDYLTKPFEIDELLARIRALIRRAAGKPSPVLTAGEVVIDTLSRRVRRAGRAVDLTPKEYALLEFLAVHAGELVTRTMIYDHIYDEQDDSLSNVVDVYVSNLRRKLGRDLLETRRGEGYVLHA